MATNVLLSFVFLMLIANICKASPCARTIESKSKTKESSFSCMGVSYSIQYWTVTAFIFNLSYQNVGSVDLLMSHVSIVTAGTVVCSPLLISNGTSLIPNISVSNCVGDGSFMLSISSGSGRSGSLSDNGGVSSSIQIDNTAPLVSVESPIPASGDRTNSFSFVVNYIGASSVNLLPSNI